MQLNDPTLFRQQALINGRWRDASSKETLAVTNPANGQQLGSVPKMGAAETARLSMPPPARCPHGAPLPPKNAPLSCAAGLS